ncbi:MAG: O-antigen ligase family protein [Akkermansiaceae bacterium]|nr:O-antigen ligase family protein [Akkermansiaceae bacterium]
MRKKPKLSMGLLLLGVATALWFAWRATISPVLELRDADLLLLGGTVGAFVVMTTITGNKIAEKIFLWTLSGLLTASVAIIVRQIGDPGFHPIFASRPVTLPSGFFGHYNECANFLIGTGFLLGASALFGSYSRITQIVWALSAVAGLVAVYYTRSRGGILAVGGGLVVFAILSLLISKRRDSKGFAVAVIALPLLFMAAVGWVYKGWGDAQTVRFQTDGTAVTDAASVIESSMRFHLYDIALSCINLHPWSGGGSRSYSWECNRFWNAVDHGTGAARPEYVHNELLQSATDYGIVGAVLLTVLLSWTSLGVVLRSCSNWNVPRSAPEDAFHIGGIAGLAGMFIQSNFSFVFHLFPGVLLLGICLARMAVQESGDDRTKFRTSLSKGILVMSGIIVCLSSFWMGARGTRVLSSLWKNYFAAPEETSPEMKIAALSDAIAIWPQATLYDDRSFTLQIMSKASGISLPSDPFTKEAISDYHEAIRLHPYDPGLRTNLAGLLNLAGDDMGAEHQYRQGAALEGGMEAAYQAHFKFCHYLVNRGMAELEKNELDAASRSFDEALRQFAKVEEKTPWMPYQQVGVDLKRALVTGVGMSYEAAGDFSGALAQYDGLAGGLRVPMADFRAGLLLGKMAETAWKERQPSKALTLFQKASQRLGAATNLPTAQQNIRDEHLSFVSARIQYLLDARITPDEGK